MGILGRVFHPTASLRYVRVLQMHPKHQIAPMRNAEDLRDRLSICDSSERIAIKSDIGSVCSRVECLNPLTKMLSK